MHPGLGGRGPVPHLSLTCHVALENHLIAVGFCLLISSMSILEIPCSAFPEGTEYFIQPCGTAQSHGAISQGGAFLVMFSLNSLAPTHRPSCHSCTSSFGDSDTPTLPTNPPKPRHCPRYAKHMQNYRSQKFYLGLGCRG